MNPSVPTGCALMQPQVGAKRWRQFERILPSRPAGGVRTVEGRPAPTKPRPVERGAGGLL